jgi:hypothetical protein
MHNGEEATAPGKPRVRAAIHLWEHSRDPRLEKLATPGRPARVGAMVARHLGAPEMGAVGEHRGWRGRRRVARRRSVLGKLHQTGKGAVGEPSGKGRRAHAVRSSVAAPGSATTPGGLHLRAAAVHAAVATPGGPTGRRSAVGGEEARGQGRGGTHRRRRAVPSACGRREWKGKNR